MESVKTQQTIGEVDFRRTIISLTNLKTGEARSLAFTDIEGRVNDIRIATSAPEDVQNLLVTAKNLLLYSWFYYPFSVTAALQASMAIERALRLKLAAQPKDTLTHLLRRAIQDGLITDAGFPRWKEYIEAFQCIHSLRKGSKKKLTLTTILLDTFPKFRNAIAHGGPLLDDLGFRHLDIAAEVILQLYPDTKASSPQ